MNANELADALDWVCENHLVGIGDADFKATATMLRQQQAEIEALRNQLWDLKSEPWGFDRTASHMAGEYVSYPVKEQLTEWEIKECWEEATEMQEHFCSQYFDFAQLILRKAQEK